MHIFYFSFGLSFLNGSSHVHTFFNVKLNDPLVYTVFKVGMKNKQYEISFEIAISKFSSCLLFLGFRFLNNSSTWLIRSLDNHLIKNDIFNIYLKYKLYTTNIKDSLSTI